jgi:hypothetical protein
MEQLKLEVTLGTSNDAELQAMQGIPQVLRDLEPSRKIAVMQYIIGRISMGDYGTVKNGKKMLLTSTTRH